MDSDSLTGFDDEFEKCYEHSWYNEVNLYKLRIQLIAFIWCVICDIFKNISEFKWRGKLRPCLNFLYLTSMVFANLIWEFTSEPSKNNPIIMYSGWYHVSHESYWLRNLTLPTKYMLGRKFKKLIRGLFLKIQETQEETVDLCLNQFLVIRKRGDILS